MKVRIINSVFGQSSPRETCCLLSFARKTIFPSPTKVRSFASEEDSIVMATVYISGCITGGNLRLQIASFELQVMGVISKPSRLNWGPSARSFISTNRSLVAKTFWLSKPSTVTFNLIVYPIWEKSLVSIVKLDPLESRRTIYSNWSCVRPEEILVKLKFLKANPQSGFCCSSGRSFTRGPKPML